MDPSLLGADDAERGRRGVEAEHVVGKVSRKRDRDAVSDFATKSQKWESFISVYFGNPLSES